MNIVSELTIESLKAKENNSLGNYESCLRSACELAPPICGMTWYGQKYRQMVRDDRWFAKSLIANGLKEGEGAMSLWKLAGYTCEHDIAEDIRQHAIDEARHAQLYITMLQLVFPDAIDVDSRLILDSMLPKYSLKHYPEKQSPISEELLFDQLIQMNLGEIRTRINQLLLRPVILAYCPPENRDRLTLIIDSIINDEVKHIRYTARLINRAMTKGFSDFICKTMYTRLAEFNEITISEVGDSRFEGA
jgi:hypothetical protein